MPPAHAIATSSIRGFVCRSCLSQLRRPQQPRTPWLVRNATGGPSRRPKNKKQGASIRYFDQTPDGQRKEVVDDPEEIAMLKNVEEQIRLLEEEDEGELVEEEEGPSDPLVHVRKAFEVPDDMMSAVREMEAQMENMSNLKNLSEEERTNIRNRILKFGTEGMSIAPPPGYLSLTPLQA